MQDSKETEQAWVQTGAATDKPLPTLLESIPGYPAIPGSDRTRILDNFGELQQKFDIREPSNLIGNPADPREAASQMAQLVGQGLLGPASGGFNQLDRTFAGGGVGNNYNNGVQQQLNQQTNIFGNVGGDVGDRVSFVVETPAPIEQKKAELPIEYLLAGTEDKT